MAKAKKVVEVKKVTPLITVKLVPTTGKTYADLTAVQKRWFHGLVDDLGEDISPDAVATLHPTLS